MDINSRKSAAEILALAKDTMYRVFATPNNILELALCYAWDEDGSEDDATRKMQTALEKEFTNILTGRGKMTRILEVRVTTPDPRGVRRIVVSLKVDTAIADCRGHIPADGETPMAGAVGAEPHHQMRAAPHSAPPVQALSKPNSATTRPASNTGGASHRPTKKPPSHGRFLRV